MPSSLSNEDRQAISDVLIRYATGIDRRDWTLFRTCWTDDARVDYDDVGSWESGDDFSRFMEEVHRSCGTSLHRVTNPSVTSDGDRVRARSYIDALVTLSETDTMRAVGYYDDELRSTSDGWKIEARRYTKVHFRIGPSSEVI